MSEVSGKKGVIGKPSLWWACFPILVTIVLVAIQILFFDESSVQVPILIGVLVAAGLGWLRGYGWEEMQEGMVRAISSAIPVFFILYVVGMLIGAWIQAGIVPLMIHIGLEFLSPGLFLFATCLICSVVSLATGTSWGTTGTIGLALIGIGGGLGIPVEITAGAVVSGAFFGDKISPLSDTTNFTPTVVGCTLFEHIRGMLPVTVPAMLIALVVYLVVGLGYADQSVDEVAINQTMTVLSQSFHFSLVLLLPPIVVLVLAVLKAPALPGLVAGLVAGVMCGLVFQDIGLHELFAVLLNGYQANTGDQSVDALLSKGGMMSMNWVISLILCALALGGVLESTRCLETILGAVMKFAHTQSRLLLSSLFSVLGVHLASGDVYLAMSLPGRMLAPAYRQRGIQVTVLSRMMEDGATVAAPLIPWSSSGVFVAATLGVGTLAYFPWAIACWASFLIDVLFALTGKCISKVDEQKSEAEGVFGEREVGGAIALQPSTASGG
ncbi:Na+/H+ antiporter NhaC [Pseudomonas sp. GCM10022186]|uniref:Na+/H+ antiporter NhaC n=1 Tax=Pseudomonas sp. GCM10022186 TaxID=3252650 RepID=UPI003610BF90